MTILDELFGCPNRFPPEGPWEATAADNAHLRGKVEDAIRRAKDAPEGPRRDAILGYMKAAERCLDGARRIALTYFALHESDEAMDAVPDGHPETDAACAELGMVDSGVFEMERDEDRREQEQKKGGTP